MLAFLDTVVGVLEVALWLVLAGAGWHLLRSARFAWWRPLGRLGTAGRLDEHPSVTVQLPMRNERYVAERAVRAACALSWPRDRLEIQVLDDSDPDDETAAIVDRVVDELRAGGAAIALLKRGDRGGFKAGNLQHGLASARGELVSVLDADCVPPPDLLERLAPPLLGDPGLGFVQARWAFANEEQNLLTRLQALILDGLFLVEQSRLAATGRPVQFNGTGGLWRRQALDAAGGFWPGPAAAASATAGAATSALTEDLDLSARAELMGYRGLTVPEVAVVTELPATMAGFCAQQRRWVAGAGQVLRGLARRLLGSARAGARTAVAHLLRHARQPVIALASLWLPAAAVGLVHPLPLPAPFARALWIVALVWVHAGFAAYGAAARRRRGLSPAAAIGFAPLLVALSVGLSLPLTISYLRGVLGIGPREFVRTVKTGAAAPSSAASPAYRTPLDPLALAAIALGAVQLAAAAVAWRHGDALGALALAGWVAGGYLWVGLGSLLDR
jgi:glycosyl transferase family 2